MIVLVYAYSGLLIAFMTVPKLEKTIETLDELAKDGRLRVTMEEKSLLTTVFLVYTLYKVV